MITWCVLHFFYNVVPYCYLCNVPLQNKLPPNAVKASKHCLRVCFFSIVFALGGLASLPCAPTVSCSLRLHRAGSGSLTRLIAFDSSLSSPVDQWSSALFIRNINVPHIPTGSASSLQASQREKLYCVILFSSIEEYCGKMVKQEYLDI